MLNVTEPAGAVRDARSIAKSFSVAETPPESEPPADELLLDELLHATAPSSATAAAATVMRVKNRSIGCLPLDGLAKRAYEATHYPDNGALKVDARAELRGGLLGPCLHAERQPDRLLPVDPKDDRVRTLLLEDETVEVERERRGPFTLR